MPSGPKKKKAALFRLYALDPAGYTNGLITEAEQIGETANQLNIAIYSSGGYAPTFTNGYSSLLSDATSNSDSAFTKAGLTGETTNAGAFVSTSLSGAVGITSGGKHYYFPRVGSEGLALTAVNSPVIIYSNDGPQSSYVPYYLGGTLATASVFFNSQITGGGTPTHLAVYVGGELATGDQIRLLHPTGAVMDAYYATGSDTVFSGLLANVSTASATQLSSHLFRKAFLIPTGNVSSGLIVEFSSSAKTSVTPVAGVFISISSGSYTP